jgi:hypothetical protein
MVDGENVTDEFVPFPPITAGPTVPAEPPAPTVTVYSVPAVTA